MLAFTVIWFAQEEALIRQLHTTTDIVQMFTKQEIHAAKQVAEAEHAEDQIDEMEVRLKQLEEFAKFDEDGDGTHSISCLTSLCIFVCRSASIPGAASQRCKGLSKHYQVR